MIKDRHIVAVIALILTVTAVIIVRSDPNASAGALAIGGFAIAGVYAMAKFAEWLD